MTQEALKLALDALENHTAIKHPQQIHYRDKAITAIKEALAQTQEPVAWMHVQGNYKEPSFRELADDEVERGWEQYPLYNTPPQRTWMGLTDEEIAQGWKESWVTEQAWQSAVWWAEDKLRNKNT
jgi:hypothetical protein